MSDKSAEGRRDPAVLRALLDRVQAAKGPDREIDREVAVLLDGYCFEKRGSDRKAWYYPINGRVRRDIEGYGPFSLDRYSSSLDASTALAERLLPGWRWKCGILEDGVCWCALYAKHHEPAEMGWAKTVPLAVLGTLLQALIASAEEGR